MKVKDIKPSAYNPRSITEQRLDMLKKSMAKFGDLGPVTVNVKTGNLISGHQRVKHLDPSWVITKTPHKDEVGTVALGHIETPFGRWQYREVDWPEKKELAANVAANQHGGEWDYPKLKDIVVDLDDGEFDMDLLGFSEEELHTMMGVVPKGKPASEDEQRQRNQKGSVECPECGAEFVAKG